MRLDCAQMERTYLITYRKEDLHFDIGGEVSPQSTKGVDSQDAR